jgi:hypothetical protein
MTKQQEKKCNEVKNLYGTYIHHLTVGFFKQMKMNQTPKRMAELDRTIAMMNEFMDKAFRARTEKSRNKWRKRLFIVFNITLPDDVFL